MVDVYKNRLVIRVYVHDELLSLGWAFAPGEIEQTPKDVLFFLADGRIKEMNDAIAERYPS